MKFLVVDDSPTMRRIMINSLKGIGFEDVIEAGDGEEAFGMLGKNPVDFIITDWNMPNMTGIDLTKKIRTTEEMKNIPIIMVTTRGQKEDILQALKANVNNFIVKPFTPQILREKIAAVLKGMKN